MAMEKACKGKQVPGSTAGAEYPPDVAVLVF